MLTHGKAVRWRDWYTFNYHENFYGTRHFDETTSPEIYQKYHEDICDCSRDREQDLLVIHSEERFAIGKKYAFLDGPYYKYRRFPL